MNTTPSTVTGFSPAFLTIGRELRQPQDSILAFQAFCHDPLFKRTSASLFLQKLSLVLVDVKDKLETPQDLRREGRNVENPGDFAGDNVLLQTHVKSLKILGISSKLAPKRDGIYKVSKKVGPTTVTVWDPVRHRTVGTVHTSELTHCPEQWETETETQEEPLVRPKETKKGHKAGQRTTKPRSVPSDIEKLELSDIPGRIQDSSRIPVRLPIKARAP